LNFPRKLDCRFCKRFQESTEQVRFIDFDQFGSVYPLDLRWVIHGFRIFDLTFYLPPCSKFVLGLKVKKKGEGGDFEREGWAEESGELDSKDGREDRLGGHLLRLLVVVCFFSLFPCFFLWPDW
jgi:hypothetical protein